MFNTQRLAIFAAIVQAGSISGAAAQLGCGKSVVSRQLARLEADLGTRLIQRSTRRLALTEIGKLVLQEAQQIDRALANVEQLTDQYQQQVRGLLRVSCSIAGRRRIVPLVTEFATRHPQLKIALQLEDRLVDLIAEQVDVAIRASHLEDSSLVARKIAENPLAVLAASSYLAKAGTPRTPDDLVNHACLVYLSDGRASDGWTFLGSGGSYKVRINPVVQINDGGALVTAAAAGAGITLLPRRLAKEELTRGELVEILQDFPLPPGAPIYAVYPARNWLALKTSAFVEFLQERLGD